MTTEARYAELLKKYEELQESSREVEEALEGEVAQLQEELDGALRASERTSATLERALREQMEHQQKASLQNDKQSRTIISLQSQLAAFEERVKKLTAKNRSLEQEKDDLERGQRTLQAELETQSEALEAAVEEQVMLKADVDDFEAEQDVLERDNATLKETVAQLTSELTQARNINNNVVGQNGDDLNGALPDDLNAARTEIDRLRQEVAHLRTSTKPRLSVMLTAPSIAHSPPAGTTRLSLAPGPSSGQPNSPREERYASLSVMPDGRPSKGRQLRAEARSARRNRSTHQLSLQGLSLQGLDGQTGANAPASPSSIGGPLSESGIAAATEVIETVFGSLTTTNSFAKVGLLEKKGKGLAQWKFLCCAINTETNMLETYVIPTSATAPSSPSSTGGSPESVQRLAGIPLPGAMISTAPFPVDGRKHVITIKPAFSRNLVMFAPLSQQECDSWLSALQKCASRPTTESEQPRGSDFSPLVSSGSSRTLTSTMAVTVGPVALTKMARRPTSRQEMIQRAKEREDLERENASANVNANEGGLTRSGSSASLLQTKGPHSGRLKIKPDGGGNGATRGPNSTASAAREWIEFMVVVNKEGTAVDCFSITDNSNLASPSSPKLTIPLVSSYQGNFAGQVVTYYTGAIITSFPDEDGEAEAGVEEGQEGGKYHHRNLFGVTVPLSGRRPLVMQASSPADKQAWMEALTYTIDCKVQRDPFSLKEGHALVRQRHEEWHEAYVVLSSGSIRVYKRGTDVEEAAFALQHDSSLKIDKKEGLFIEAFVLGGQTSLDSSSSSDLPGNNNSSGNNSNNNNNNNSTISAGLLPFMNRRNSFSQNNNNGATSSSARSPPTSPSSPFTLLSTSNNAVTNNGLLQLRGLTIKDTEAWGVAFTKEMRRLKSSGKPRGTAGSSGALSSPIGATLSGGPLRRLSMHGRNGSNKELVSNAGPNMSGASDRRSSFSLSFSPSTNRQIHIDEQLAPPSGSKRSDKEKENVNGGASSTGKSGKSGFLTLRKEGLVSVQWKRLLFLLTAENTNTLEFFESSAPPLPLSPPGKRNSIVTSAAATIDDSNVLVDAATGKKLVSVDDVLYALGRKVGGIPLTNAIIMDLDLEGEAFWGIGRADKPGESKWCLALIPAHSTRLYVLRATSDTEKLDWMEILRPRIRRFRYRDSLCEGYLTKKKRKGESWSERYVVVNPRGKLQYYHRKVNNQSSAVISLTAQTVVQREEDSDGDLSLAFSVRDPSTSDRALFLRAKGKLELELWLSALQTACTHTPDLGDEDSRERERDQSDDSSRSHESHRSALSSQRAMLGATAASSNGHRGSGAQSALSHSAARIREDPVAEEQEGREGKPQAKVSLGLPGTPPLSPERTDRSRSSSRKSLGSAPRPQHTSIRPSRGSRSVPLPDTHATTEPQPENPGNDARDHSDNHDQLENTAEQKSKKGGLFGWLRRKH